MDNFIDTRIGRLKVSLHFKKRMRSRNISIKEIKNCINEPKKLTIKESDNTYAYIDGDVKVLVNSKDMVLITVFRFSIEYARSKNKNIRNKNAKNIKKTYGNYGKRSKKK